MSSPPILRIAQNFTLQTSVLSVFVYYGFSEEVSDKMTKLGHWYACDCDVWLQLLRLWQGRDLVCLPYESTTVLLAARLVYP